MAKRSASMAGNDQASPQAKVATQKAMVPANSTLRRLKRSEIGPENTAVRQ
nr:hypothetical protein [Propionibacterium freudenreichii]